MTAAPLPPGMWTFVDINGEPLVAATVEHYQPSSLTPKDTWRDYNQQVLNSNPITLDARGQAAIWGSGRYRQILKDSLGNTIWDKETFVSEPAQASDVIMTWTGIPSAATQFLGGEYVSRTLVFGADFPGAGGLTPETEPALDYVVTIVKITNGVTTTIGTATRDVSETEWVFATTGNVAQTVLEGSQIKFYGPLAPGTIADFGLTLPATQTP